MSPNQISNGNLQKDNFHNPILGIDKRCIWCIVNPTSQINFLFPKGVVDGERPLEFPLKMQGYYLIIFPFHFFQG